MGTARAYYEESLALCRERGEQLWAVRLLNNLGVQALSEGDFPRARALLEETIALGPKVGHEQIVSYAITNLGLVALREGDAATACALLREGLERKRRLRLEKGGVWNLDGLAVAAVLLGQNERAARLFGCAAASREAADAAIPPLEPEWLEEQMALARAALGEEAFTAAWAEGRALRLDEAVCVALEESEK